MMKWAVFNVPFARAVCVIMSLCKIIYVSFMIIVVTLDVPNVALLSCGEVRWGIMSDSCMRNKDRMHVRNVQRPFDGKVI